MGVREAHLRDLKLGDVQYSLLFHGIAGNLQTFRAVNLNLGIRSPVKSERREKAGGCLDALF